MDKFDLAIIGGGPGGYNTAAHASQAGLRTVLFERGALGGVCLNEGCIPTKSLLYSANLYDEIRESQKYGIKIEGAIEPDYKKVVARKTKIVKKLIAGVSTKLDGAGVHVVRESARLDGREGSAIRILSGEDVVLADRVILATGSDVFVPPIPGLSEVSYWTSREALEAKELPSDLLIIGGGVIGMEFASLFTSMGVRVTVVEMMPEILGAMDKELSAMLREVYSKRGVTFYLQTKVVSVGNGVVCVETSDGGSLELAASQILVSVGRRPVLGSLGLETLGVETERGGVRVDEYMRTTAEGVYACGDITGFSMLAHTAIREGEVALDHILHGQQASPMSYRAIPGVVYTHPEIAGVGATEEALVAEGRPYRVLSLPMSYAGRFVVENERGEGVCKVLVDEDNRLLGCHMIGNPASEIILLAGVAIEGGQTAEEFRSHVFPHPTVGEILHEVLYKA